MSWRRNRLECRRNSRGEHRRPVRPRPRGTIHVSFSAAARAIRPRRAAPSRRPCNRAPRGNHCNAVGVEARDHRRVHRVRRAEAPEQERPAIARTRQSRQIASMRRDVRRAPPPTRTRAYRTAPHVHRAVAGAAPESPQCISAEIARACARASRPPARGPLVGKFLGEIFDDRERLPDVHVAVDQHRHLAGRRVLRQPRLEVGLPSGASNGITISSNGMPATFMAIQGRNDQDE